MSHAASGETDKARVHIGKCLGKVGTQTVLSAFECILREERNHIQFDFTCRLRTSMPGCPPLETTGLVSFNRELGVYITLRFEPGADISDDTLDTIARTVRLSPAE